MLRCSAVVSVVLNLIKNTLKVIDGYKYVKQPINQLINNNHFRNVCCNLIEISHCCFVFDVHNDSSVM